MKLILIAITTITGVLGGKCPAKEIIAPCECTEATDIIACQKNLTQISKAFQSASKNLGTNERHFDEVDIYSFESLSLEDDTFGDITFDTFHGRNINLIGSNAFSKTGSKTKMLFCLSCALEHQPPKYNLQNVFNQMTGLKTLSIGLNITEIPTDVVPPVPGQESKLSYLYIKSHQPLTIRSGAFQNLGQLYSAQISDSQIDRIENGAFKFVNRTESVLRISFSSCKLTGKSFHNGSFDGAQSQLIIAFSNSTIDYLNEGAFKSVLDGKNNWIDFQKPVFGFNSKIDCDNCNNYWLIKEGKQKQILDAYCKSNYKVKLFDKEIQDKLSQKCK